MFMVLMRTSSFVASNHSIEKFHSHFKKKLRDPVSWTEKEGSGGGAVKATLSSK